MGGGGLGVDYSGGRCDVFEAFWSITAINAGDHKNMASVGRILQTLKKHSYVPNI